MRPWPLGRKLTLWSALMAGVSLFLCMEGAIWILRHQETAEFDRLLAREAEDFFYDLKILGGGSVSNLSVITDEMISPTVEGRFVELRGRHQEVIYKSANLGERDLQVQFPGQRTGYLDRQHVRTGVFKDGDFTLYLAADIKEVDDVVGRLVSAFWIALPLIVAVVGVGSLWIARQALAPIRAIAATAERITAERLDQRFEVPATKDEVGRLIAVLNKMFDRLDAGFQQAKRFSADASHELMTPLTVIRTGLEDLLRSPNIDGGMEQTLGELLEETRRLAGISSDLLLLSRADAGRLEIKRSKVDLCDVIESCLEDIRILADPHAITIDTELPESAILDGDPDKLTQVCINLLDNAVKYNRDGGRIRVWVKSQETLCELHVANTGPGISPEDANRLFERFYRGDPSIQRGCGLGLSIARELTRAHGGDLTLVSSDSQWTEFCVRLPKI